MASNAVQPESAAPAGGSTDGNAPVRRTWSDQLPIVKCTSISFASAVTCGICIAVPLAVLDMRKRGFEYHYIAWCIAGLFSLVSVPFTLVEIFSHLAAYCNPPLQRQVLRILLMPVVYTADAWLALRFKEVGLYWDALRGCYEGWVIYAFFSLLKTYLRQRIEDPASAEALEEVAAHDHKHVFPLCFMKPWASRSADGNPLHSRMFRLSQACVLQYVVAIVSETIVVFATQYGGVYGDGIMSAKVAYPYLTLFVTLSQLVSLYALVYFYHAYRAVLLPINPFRKFVCIKGVVFFTFWQEMIISGIAARGWVKANPAWGDYDPGTVAGKEYLAAGAQDFLICLEMLMFAILFAYAFPPSDWEKDGTGTITGVGGALKELLAVGDVARDIKESAKYVASPRQEAPHHRDERQAETARGEEGVELAEATPVKPDKGKGKA